MKMSKRISKKYKSNCYIELLRLLFKGKLRGILWAWPFHWMGITKKGNYIHFTSKNRPIMSQWFVGQIEIIKRFQIKRMHYGLEFNGAGKFTWIRRRVSEPLEGFI
jgi:hypothetical protein